MSFKMGNSIVIATRTIVRTESSGCIAGSPETQFEIPDFVDLKTENPIDALIATDARLDLLCQVFIEQLETCRRGMLVRGPQRGGIVQIWDVDEVNDRNGTDRRSVA